MRYTVSLTAGVLTLGLITGLMTRQFHPGPPNSVDMSLISHAGHVHPHSHDRADPSGPDYRSPGKPGADISLISPQIQTLPLGVTREVQLEMASHLPKGALRVSLELSDGLTLTSGEREWQFDIEGADSMTMPISVQADVEGQHYVHLFIEHQAENGVNSARALATEIRVGDGLLENAFAKSFRSVKADEFRSLPVQETIY